MDPAGQRRALTDAELDRLDAALAAIDPDDSMALEELDGYCAALACCPDAVPRDEWLPAVLGRTPRARAAQRADGPDAGAVALIERHRAAVAAMLDAGEGFSPVLSHDEHGRPWGHAWAVGFARGMGLHPDAWEPLDEDAEYADALDPLMRLVAEAQRDDVAPADDAGPADDSDAAVEPIADDEREEVIHQMLDGVHDVHEFFRVARQRAYSPPPARRAEAKVGRNDPCPCGSGRKYKYCHGAGSS